MNSLGAHLFRRCRPSILGTCLVLTAAGCGSNNLELTGTVTYNNGSLPYGTVTLYCNDGHIVSGLIEEDGSFRIPNVPRGPARVTVVTHPPIPRGFQLPQQLPKSKDAPVLSNYGSQTNALALKKYVPIPDRYSSPDQSGLAVEVTRTNRNVDLELTP